MRSSVPDPRHFGTDTDADPGIWMWIRLRILLFSSVTFKMPTKIIFFSLKFLCLLLSEGIFTQFFKDKSQKEVTNQ
jgi:hypothetical protein